MVELVQQSMPMSQSGAFLSKYMRLAVYSYFDFKETTFTLSRLSRQERYNLRGSEKARIGNSIDLEVGRIWPFYMLEESRLEQWMKRAEFSINITDEIYIIVSAEQARRVGENSNVSDEIAAFI